MSRETFDNSFGPSHRRVIVQSYQLPNSQSRRNIAPTSRDFTSQSNVQSRQHRHVTSPPSHRYQGEDSHFNEYSNSTRSLSNRMNSAYDDQSNRRYQLELPSMRLPVRQSQSYHVDHPNPTHTTNRHYSNIQQPSTHYSSGFEPSRRDQNYPRYEREYREETHPSQSYPVQSTHRSIETSFGNQHSNRVRSLNHPSSSVRNVQINRPFDMTYFLNNILQTFLGESRSTFHDYGIDRSSSDPMSLLANALMTGRPDVFMVPGAFHIHFGDLFDLQPRGEPPSVGLQDDEIERLPTTTYRKTNKSSSTDEKCAICLSEYKTGETVKRLRCKHFFHPECIDPWLKTSTQCPVCRGQQSD